MPGGCAAASGWASDEAGSAVIVSGGADSLPAGAEGAGSDSEVGARNSVATVAGAATAFEASASLAYSCFKLQPRAAATVSPMDGGMIVGAVSAACVIATGPLS